jgi:hypothetical protein
MKFSQWTKSESCLDDLTRAPLTPCLMYQMLSEEEIRRIQQWTDDWFSAALEQELIRWPYVTDETTIREIQVCYRSGLTPEEGVLFCFGTRDSNAAS